MGAGSRDSTRSGLPLLRKEKLFTSQGKKQLPRIFVRGGGGEEKELARSSGTKRTKKVKYVDRGKGKIKGKSERKERKRGRRS